MADRTVSVRLNAQVAGYIAQMQAAGRATAQVGQQGAGVAKDLGMLSPKLMGIGAAAGFMAVTAVKKFADFDAAMSGVKAATKEGAAGMEQLRSAAEEAGASTVYSATESADAITNLAKAGVSTADILSGGLDGALALAAAGSMDVADAAEIASAALVTFKLDGEDMTHVADLLAAGAGKAMGEVSDLGMALKMTGTVAAQTGLSIEETTATLSAMASRGLIGSDAGTSLKSFLQRLIPESFAAQKAMESIGLAAYDAQGNFIGLEAVAGQLRSGLSKLTQEQQASALKTIFGSDAVRAAAIIYEEGAQGIEAWTGKVNDAGFAAETAATLTDNLKGDIERLTGALDTLFINAGEGANGPLRDLIQGLTGVADAVGVAQKAGEENQGAGPLTPIWRIPGNVWNMRPEPWGGTGMDGKRTPPLPPAKVSDDTWLSRARGTEDVGDKMLALARGARSADESVQDLADALDQQEQAAADAAKAMDLANKSYLNAIDYALRAADAAIGWEAALDDTTETLKKNGRTVDIGTEKGRANAQAIIGMGQAARDLIAEMIAAGDSQDDVAKKADSMADALYDAARQAGYSKDKASELADTLRAVPDEVKTEYTTKGADTYRAKADAAKDAVDAIPRSVVTKWTFSAGKVWNPTLGAWVSSGPTVKRHGGGDVPGSGDVAATLKGGEYVINDRAYAANRDLVRAINAGVNVSAAGGFNIGQVNVTESPKTTRQNVIDALAEAAYRGGGVR